MNVPTSTFGTMFLNKLGTYDSFNFIGVKEETISRESKQFTVAKQVSPDGSSPDGFSYNTAYDTEVTKKVLVNSGWIDEQYFDWLIELLSSNVIFSYSTPTDNYLLVDSYKYAKNSNDSLYNIEVVFTQTIYENNIAV